MRPLSLALPKAFLPFCGRPLVEYIFEQLARNRIRTAILVVGFCDAHYEQYVRWGRSKGLQVIVVKRSLEFGSAGVVRHVVETLPALNRFSDFLVVYPDSVLSIDFKRMASVHAARKATGCLLTVCHHKPEDLVASGNPKSNYGVLLTDSDGRVTSFVEKPSAEKVDERHVANAGVLMVDRRLFRRFPESSPLDFSRDVLQSLARGKTSPAFGFDIGSGFRHDVGTMREYVMKQFDVLAGRLTLRGVPARLIHADCRLANGATVVGKALIGPRSLFEKDAKLCGGNIIGHGVRVGARSVIEESVVLDNTTIGSDVQITGAVIGPHCVISDGVALNKGTVLGGYSSLS